MERLPSYKRERPRAGTLDADHVMHRIQGKAKNEPCKHRRKKGSGTINRKGHVAAQMDEKVRVPELPNSCETEATRSS